MSLNKKLDETRAASAKRRPAETRAIMPRATDDLRDSKMPEGTHSGWGLTVSERGLGLNRILYRHAAYVKSFKELLDVARSANDDFMSR